MKTCFVVMPYGEKDLNGKLVDFDAIYFDIIGEAIKAAGFKEHRSDLHGPGGWIHKSMIRQIHDAEACVVDLTTANANVFYELGVRHALRRRTTVLLRKEGAKIPFNVQGMRIISYSVDKPEMAREAIRSALVARYSDHDHTDSLVYDVLPDLRIPIPERPIADPRRLRYKILRKPPGRSIGIVTGDVLGIRDVDVWVNSENTSMQMARFFDRSMCSTIRYAGARKDGANRVIDDVIANELEEITGRKSVDAATAIFTTSGELSKTHNVCGIIHVAAVSGQPGHGYRPVEGLDKCVRNVLIQFDDLKTRDDERLSILAKAKSILFPLLGTGTAGGDATKIVPQQIEAAIGYLESHPRSAIRSIWFLAYTPDHFDLLRNIFNAMPDRCALVSARVSAGQPGRTAS